MDSKKTLTMFDNTEKTVRVNTPGCRMTNFFLLEK